MEDAGARMFDFAQTPYRFRSYVGAGRQSLPFGTARQSVTFTA